MKVICTQPHDAERDKLAAELAQLRADIKALKPERDEASTLVRLRDEVDRLRREKAQLAEDNNRKIRETEHKVGLLKTKQDQDIAHARRQTELEVREANLQADKDRFKAEMDFQREQLQKQIGSTEDILRAVLDRLPSIDVALEGRAAPKARTARRDED